MAPNIRKLQALIATVDMGNFTNAAGMLGCSQSSVSRMVQGLEEKWGVKLLERRGGKVTLTAEGQDLLPDIRDLCDSYAHLGGHVDSLKGVESGVLSIAAPASIVTHRLPRALSLFAAGHEGVEIRIVVCTYEDAERLVECGGVDVAFIPGQPSSERFVSRLFERDEMLVVGPRGHFSSVGERVMLQGIVNERFVVDTETAPLLQKKLTNTVIRCISSDVTCILALVEAGFGISLLPSLALTDQRFDIDVRRLDPPAFRLMYMVYPRNRTLSHAARVFVDCAMGMKEGGTPPDAGASRGKRGKPHASGGACGRERTSSADKE